MCANLHHIGKYLLKINPEKLAPGYSRLNSKEAIITKLSPT